MPDQPWGVPVRGASALAPHTVEAAQVPRQSLGRRAGDVAAAIPLPPPVGQNEQIRTLATRALAAEADRHVRKQGRRLVALTATLGVLAVIVGGLWEKSGNDGRAPTTPRTAEAPRQAAIESAMSLLASAGYVVSPDGGFLTGRSGREIESFTLPIRCHSRQLVIRGIPVRRRSIRFVGTAVGQVVFVRLQGRIIDQRHVRGVVAVTGKTCSATRVAFSARLS
jgi:hypothetical protein